MPKSTLYYFKNNSAKINSEGTEFYNNLFKNYEDQIKYKTFIYDSIKPPTFPMNWSKIWGNFFKKFGLSLNKRELKEFLKKDLNFSFKRGSSTVRLKNINDDTRMKQIFSLEILNSIINKKLIINIDEVWFSKKLANNYSWLPKSATSAIINQESSGIWSMITVFFSNGQHLNLLYDWTITSKEICEFLSILRYSIT